MPDNLTCKSARPGRRTSRVAFEDAPPDADDPLLGFAPYLHRQPRRNAITPDRQRAFIAALAATGVVTQAARSIGASLEALYKLRALPGAEHFAAAWELAIDRGVARLEDCALERAILGEERPVVSRGEVIASYRRHDTQLILFLLRQRRRERYGVDGDPRPGSAAYERLRARWQAEWLAEWEAQQPSEEEVLASIDEMLDTMIANAAANADVGEGDA